MTLKDKIEDYLYKLTLTFQSPSPDTWVIDDDEKGLRNVVVLADEPIVVFRVKVMDLPANNREEFFEKLLRLNAQDLVHGAYGLEGDSVILLNTLFAETMDIEEFQSTLDALGLALRQHYEILSKYRKQ